MLGTFELLWRLNFKYQSQQMATDSRQVNIVREVSNLEPVLLQIISVIQKTQRTLADSHSMLKVTCILWKTYLIAIFDICFDENLQK